VNPKLLFTFGIIGIIALILQGISLGLHLPISILFDDTCHTVINFLDPSKPNNTVAFNILITCFQDGSFLPAFDSTFHIAQSIMVTLNNITTEVLGYSFNPTFNSTGQSLDNLVHQTVTKIRDITNDINQRIANQPQSPSIIQIKKLLNSLSSISEILLDLLSIANCSYLTDFAKNILEATCVSIVFGTLFTYGSNIVFCATFGVAVIIGLICVYLFKFSIHTKRRKSLYNPRRFRLQTVTLWIFIASFLVFFDPEIEFSQYTIFSSISVIIAIVGLIGVSLRNFVILLGLGMCSLAFFFLLGYSLYFTNLSHITL